MNRFLILTALLLNIAACDAGNTLPVAQKSSSQSGQPKCTSTPCGNTASGKDPQQESLEAGERIENALRASDEDRQRWSIPIYSTSERPEDLSLEVARSAGMGLRLLSDQGHLAISTPSSKHVFAIARPRGSGDVCPVYNLHVIDASDEHILLKRICRKFEYKPGRFARSVTYYLYDKPTGTMRDIWTAGASGKDDPSPDAKPTPVVKRIANGYQFDWSGIIAGNPAGQPIEIHNRFTRVADGAKRTLGCTNVSTGAGRGDASVCEGEYLERIGG